MTKVHSEFPRWRWQAICLLFGQCKEHFSIYFIIFVNRHIDVSNKIKIEQKQGIHHFYSWIGCSLLWSGTECHRSWKVLKLCKFHLTSFISTLFCLYFILIWVSDPEVVCRDSSTAKLCICVYVLQNVSTFAICIYVSLRFYCECFSYYWQM